MDVVDATKADPRAEREPAGSVPTVTCAEDLRLLSHEELMEVYRQSLAPSSVRALDGHPKGYGIAPIVMAGGRVDRWLRRYSQSETFVWHGKTLESFSDEQGWGWNRFARGPVLAAFPFRTYVGPSKVDRAPTLIFDFDVPKNPWWERFTWDEVREVCPGVFFGISALRILGTFHPVAWFALDTNQQTPLVGV